MSLALLLPHRLGGAWPVPALPLCLSPMAAAVSVTGHNHVQLIGIQFMANKENRMTFTQQTN